MEHANRVAKKIREVSDSFGPKIWENNVKGGNKSICKKGPFIVQTCG